MTCFKIVHLDLSTGRRTYLPWGFSCHEAAQEKIMELTLANPRHRYIVMLAPMGTSH